MYKKFNFGFTLAEVLITLGIIGVVAAMTLPTLIQNYKKQQTITALKKSYTLLNQVFKLSELDNGEYATWTIPEGDNPSLSYIEKYYLPYFKNDIKICDTPQKCGFKSNEPFKLLDGSNSNATLTFPAYRTPFLTSDGIMYSVSVGGGGDSATSIFIDINGPKEPNTLGKDYFQFKQTNKGIIPARASDDEIKCTVEYAWDCSAKIIADGWEISDDYPW